MRLWPALFALALGLLPISTKAQEDGTIRILFDPATGTIAQQLETLILSNPSWEAMGLKAVRADSEGQPPLAALENGLADLAFLPIDQVRDDFLPDLGTAALLSEPFLALSTDDTEAVLRSGYRDLVLMDLSRGRSLPMGFVSLGSSHLVSQRSLTAAADFDTLRMAEIDPMVPMAGLTEFGSFDALGADIIRIAPESGPTALAQGQVDAAEIPTIEMVAPMLEQLREGQITTDVTSQLLVALVRLGFWEEVSIAQQDALIEALDRIEAQSFQMVRQTEESARAQWAEQGFAMRSFATTLGQEGVAVQRAQWAEGSAERQRALRAFDALVPEPAPEMAPIELDTHDEGAAPQTRIYFATDRTYDPASRKFGREQTTDVDLRCGSLNWQEDATRGSKGHVAKDTYQISAGPWPDDNCYSALRLALGSTPGPVLLFVHGYRHDFDKAMRRVIPLAEDLDWPGIVLTWTWPSVGQPAAYISDAQHNRDSSWRFNRFLNRLTDENPDLRFHLVAHSMGARLAVEAVHSFQHHSPNPILQTVLLAADVSDRTLEDIIHYRQSGHRMTIYANEHDTALGWSSAKYMNSRPRAGQAGDTLIVMPGLETVDVSPVGNTMTPHNYPFTLPRAQADLRMLLRDDIPAAGRALTQRDRQGTLFWTMDPAGN